MITVTVNTVTVFPSTGRPPHGGRSDDKPSDGGAALVGSAPIAEALRGSWPDVELLCEPSPLTGGYWAAMWRVRLTGTPAGIPGELVVRVMPDATMGAKEMAVQAAVARAGITTPRVHLTGPPGGPLGNAWAVMDLAPGAPSIAGLDGAAALRRLPRLATALPHQLAEAMAGIHRVDPAPVAAAVREAAPSAAFTVDELWTRLRASVAGTGRADLDDALDRLVAGEPRRARAVICHGDFHPFNLLTSATRTTVLDWTGAVAAPPAYDVAFTWLLLRYPPLAAPPALRPVIGAAAAALARRFVHLYRRANPAADLTGLRWYVGLHALRILSDHQTWARNGDRRAREHPLSLVAPGATRALRRAVSTPSTGRTRPPDPLDSSRPSTGRDGPDQDGYP
ncbi:MAG TPA: phosphotransferase [Acidimicrobiales bacterium]|nr:phosphotransferase [Acidimicrobiales bacterium]